MRFIVLFAFAACAVTLLSADSKERVYKVGDDGVTAPLPIERVDPAYTEEARNEHVEGTVVLKAEITPQGRVENVTVVKSLRSDLDKNAIEAFRGWLFKPGEKDGKPVRVQATMEINFRLN